MRDEFVSACVPYTRVTLKPLQRSIVATLVLTLGLLAALSSETRQPESRPALSVMTFNIRYGTADDGENNWAARRELLYQVIREQDADVIGLQEALDFQIDAILAAVPGYAVVGVGRNDGARKGEYAAILFRKDRLQVASSGTFWFSDTPEVVASTTWGNRITRICTWARFIDRDGRAFWHFNLHLDHESQPSREKSVELLRRRVDARAFPNEPVVITGDFNVGEKNPALAALVAGGAFLDTFRQMHPEEKRAGTFTGFTAGKVDGDKIDYIFVQPGTTVLAAEIVRTSRNDRYPSDHFPVTARIRWKA